MKNEKGKLERTAYKLYAHGDKTDIRRIYKDSEDVQWIFYEGSWCKVSDIIRSCDKRNVFWTYLVG